jgi:hypothetical protein
VTFALCKFDKEIKSNGGTKMAVLLNNSVKLPAAALTALILIVYCGSLSAQNNEYYSSSAKKQSFMLNNLINGINSENDGLRRSAIYFAGKYQVSELAGALTKQLETETSPQNRALILLTLYRISGEECNKAIQKYVINGRDPEARKLAQSMLNEYTINNLPSLSTDR